MNFHPLFIREEIVKAVREFFYERNFHEVIPPTLNRALPLEPNIFAFSTEWQNINSQETFYLSTSPESGLKKMLAQGIGNCFAIAKCFRNLEDSSDHHNPEFLMLEWYREHATYINIMEDTQLLIQYVAGKISEGKHINVAAPWKTYSLLDLYTRYVGFSYLDVLDAHSLKEKALRKGYSIEGANWEQLFNQIFLNEIEPQLGQDPCFVTDFPSQISPLAKPNAENPHVAERFELYIAGKEVGNGNTEHTDIQRIQSTFQSEAVNRQQSQRILPPIDQTFINALQIMQKKSYAGIGLGIDRLAMIFSDVSSIEEVEPLAVR